MIGTPARQRLVLTLAVAATATAQGGSRLLYLPAIGPAPLRFESLGPKQTLPPLPVKPLPAESTSSSSHAPPTEPALSIPAQPADRRAGATPFLPNRSAGLSENNRNLTPPVSGPGTETNAPPVVSPEVLVQLVTQRLGTNELLSTEVPLRFTPPTPPAPGSSSATYISLPKP